MLVFGWEISPFSESLTKPSLWHRARQHRSLLRPALLTGWQERGETQVEVVTGDSGHKTGARRAEEHLSHLPASRLHQPAHLLPQPRFWPDARRAASPQPGPGATVVGIFSIESSSRGPGPGRCWRCELRFSTLTAHSAQCQRGVTSWARLSTLGWFPCRRSPHCTLSWGSDGSSNVSCCEM